MQNLGPQAAIKEIINELVNMFPKNQTLRAMQERFGTALKTSWITRREQERYDVSFQGEEGRVDKTIIGRDNLLTELKYKQSYFAVLMARGGGNSFQHSWGTGHITVTRVRAEHEPLIPRRPRITQEEKDQAAIASGGAPNFRQQRLEAIQRSMHKHDSVEHAPETPTKQANKVPTKSAKKKVVRKCK